MRSNDSINPSPYFHANCWGRAALRNMHDLCSQVVCLREKHNTWEQYLTDKPASYQTVFEELLKLTGWEHS